MQHFFSSSFWAILGFGLISTLFQKKKRKRNTNLYLTEGWGGGGGKDGQEQGNAGWEGEEDGQEQDHQINQPEFVHGSNKYTNGSNV